MINDQIIAPQDLPENLDIYGADFRWGVSGQSQVIVDINGQHYVLTPQSIEVADDNTVAVARIYRKGALSDPSWRLEVQSGVGELQHGIGKMTLSNAESQMAETAWRQASLQSSLFSNLTRMAEVMNYFSSMEEADHELYGEMQREWHMELELTVLAVDIISIPEGQERDKKIEELRQRLSEVFDLKQENRRREVDQLESELNRLRQRMVERKAARERLIEARLKELLGSAYKS